MTGPADADRRVQQALLRALAGGAAGPVWQAVADAARRGDCTLRQAADSSAFRDLFLDAADRGVQRREQIGEDATQQERWAAQRVVDDIVAQVRPHDG